jgi:glycosyltransferase involved in cell wall biosynthesis
MNLKPGISVVVPVYRSERTLRELVSRISTSIIDQNFEIILVDDESGASTWQEISQICNLNSKVHGLRLGRNSGQQAALLAGVRFAHYSVVVTMDDDLQNPPEEIPKLLMALTESIDVVCGISTEVQQSFYRRLGSKFSRGIIASLLGFSDLTSMSSFRAFRTNLRSGFDSELGPNVSLDALLTWSTSRFGTTRVNHDMRAQGVSNYSLRKLMRFMIDIATSYSTLPLRFASYIGFMTVIFGLVLMSYIIAGPLIFGIVVPGFALLASSITLFAGVQIMALGIIGEYIGKIHFRVMNKPTYLVTEIIGTNSITDI